MSKKRKSSLLELLQKHPILKWIFFIAAIIGAITTILKVPTGVYDFINQKLNTYNEEYEYLEELKVGTSIEYIKSILGEPNLSKVCTQDVNSDLFGYDCQFPNTSKHRYTFERQNYFIQVLTDENDIATGYTIFLKNLNFNPTVNLFLGRFIDSKSLTLGKTNFSEFENLEDGYSISIDEPVLGNNFAGYFKLIYSSDYAVDYFFIISTISSAPWSNFYTETECDFSLLANYDYIDGEMVDLDSEKYESNLSDFKNQCSIQSISVLDIKNLSEDFWQKEDQEKEEFLRGQIQFFYFP